MFALSTEIKNQWARDDPAFVVLLLAFLLAASVVYAIAFRCSSVMQYLILVARTHAHAQFEHRLYRFDNLSAFTSVYQLPHESFRVDFMLSQKHEIFFRVIMLL